jgi:protein TonB
MDGERLTSGLSVAALHVLAAWVLLAGMGAEAARSPQRALTLFDVAPPLPPPEVPPPPPPKRAAPREEGRASPPNLRARATPVVAPKAVLPVEAPVVAAPKAGTGSAPSAGNAPVPGRGSGAGGSGVGSGAGGQGSGPGGGGGGIARARLLRGRIDDRDYPQSAARSRVEGVVTVKLDVGVNGRVTHCGVLRSSGNEALDATTCRLVRERFLYAPARDRDGRAVPDATGWRQSWWLERRGKGQD